MAILLNDNFTSLTGWITYSGSPVMAAGVFSGGVVYRDLGARATSIRGAIGTPPTGTEYVSVQFGSNADASKRYQVGCQAGLWFFVKDAIAAPLDSYAAAISPGDTFKVTIPDDNTKPMTVEINGVQRMTSADTENRDNTYLALAVSGAATLAVDPTAGAFVVEGAGSGSAYTDLFLRIFQHLLPRARAWSLTADKTIRKFFRSLAATAANARDFIDQVWGDLWPDDTRELSAWEQQFNLPAVGLSEADRRLRLAGAWQALGGQSPRYIQDTLRAAGFDVYVHNWWVPGSEPAVGVKGQATARDPHDYLRENSAAPAEPGKGYALVNRIFPTGPAYLTGCGDTNMEAGEAVAQCGEFKTFHIFQRNYTLPTDPDYYPYFLYIGGAVFGNLASIPAARQVEFEELCLKICPSQLWLGILVEYT